MRELLIDTLAHIPPANALEGLTASDAERRLAGASHSIAEIVAHMDYWQRWFCGRCEGSGEAMPAKAAQGWPPVPAGSWKDLEQRFVNGLERAAALGGDTASLNAAVTPAIEFPPLANFTRRDALVHLATHNAHHLGQVIVLRQMMGLWPPPAGGWTW